MNATELRIGNLVYGDGFHNVESIDTVTGIFQEFEGEDLVTYVLTKDFKFLLSDCKPIPLTEEWLLKAGFEKQNRHNHPEMFAYVKDGIDLIHTVDNGQSFYLPCLDEPQLRYVHHFQNLIHSLTGQELQFN